MFHFLHYTEESPPAHPILGHLLPFKRDPLGFLSHCANSYDRVVPLRMLHVPALLLLDPDDIEKVLVTDRANFAKPSWLRTPSVKRLLGDGLVTSEGDEWLEQRQICQPAFHLQRMEDYGDTICSLTGKLLRGWESQQSLDLLKVMARLTLQVMAATLCGFDEDGWSEEVATEIEILLKGFSSANSFFGMLPLPPGLNEFRAERRLNSSLDYLIRKRNAKNFVNDDDAAPECPYASEPPGKAGTNLDFLSLLEMAQRSGAKQKTGVSLREQIKTFISAGFESSSLTLCWAFILIARHPEVEARLLDELQGVLQGRPPAYSDLSELHVTRAIIQEAMRLYPPLWMTGRQAKRSCEIAGRRVSAGTLILTSQWAVHRMQRYFPLPNEFRPERWNSPETKNRHKYAYFPFGGGPRICIAQGFAMMETMLILATIAQKFSLKLDSPSEIEPCASMTLRPKSSVYVRLEKRA